MRINPGSIDITPAGPTFTVSGAITNPADLLGLMLNNKDLTSALEPAEMALLKSLYTQMSAVNPTPAVQRAFAGLVDTSQPINAVQLLTDVQDLLANLRVEGGLVPVTVNSTATGNSTSRTNGTLSNGTSDVPDTVIIPAPTTSPFSTPSGAQLLKPVRAFSGAAPVGVFPTFACALLTAILWMIIL